MKGKAVSMVMMILALISLLTLIVDIKIGNANPETIYIRADGSIDPPTANITTVDNVTYIFTDNNYDEVVIERDNVVIDGVGYTLQVQYGLAGVYLAGRSNITIRNMEIKGFDYGIYLHSSSNNTISGNNITTIYEAGIRVRESSNNTIHGNNIACKYDMWGGIWALYGSSNSIYGNNITGNGGYGILLADSSNNSINENNITANLYNGIGIVRSSNNGVYGNYIAANYEAGIRLYESSKNLIFHNNLTNNLDGIELRYCSNNSIWENYVAESDWGISVLYSSNNTCIRENNLRGNTFAGIRLMFDSSNNTVSGNNITTTLEVGLVAGGSSNIIYGNNITENNYGISLSGSSHSLSENNITSNWFGIRLTGGSGNLIFHNNFIDNRFEQIDIFDSGTNTWDDGYPSGGNYWSDHTSSDFYSGSNQDQLGKDGIVDTPYVIDANNRDDYPLMKPYPRGQHDIGITNIVPSKTVVGQEFSVYVNVTIFNYGNNTENFNVTIFANSTVVDTLTNISLTKGHFDIITMTWNTTGFDKGNYNVSVYATPVPNETYTEDNTYPYWVLITVVGDVDGDRDVDVGDQRKVQLAMFSVPGSPSWDPNADIDCDLDVDVGDQRKQQLHMFESW